MRHPENRQADAGVIRSRGVRLASAPSGQPDAPSYSDARALAAVERTLLESGHFYYSAQWVVRELARDILRAVSRLDS